MTSLIVRLLRAIGLRRLAERISPAGRVQRDARVAPEQPRPDGPR